MVYVNNMYDWARHMRKIARWRPGGPRVLGLRGAELVRERPSKVGQAPVPRTAPKEREDATQDTE